MSTGNNEMSPEYVLVASSSTARMGIIRNTRTNQFYRSYGSVPWEFLQTDIMRVHSLIANGMLVVYDPEIPLERYYEWPKKARESKQQLGFTPTGGMTAEEVEAYGRGQFNPADKKILKRRTA